MNARMFDGIAEVVRRMLECYQNGKRIEAMSEAVDFLVNHREYVMYFQSQQCIVDEGAFVRELRKRSIRVFDSLFAKDGSIKDTDLYVTSIYVGTTIFIFTLIRFDALDTNTPNIADSADFADKLAALIENGIGKNIPERKRLAQLDARFKSAMQKKRRLPTSFLHSLPSCPNTELQALRSNAWQKNYASQKALFIRAIKVKTKWSNRL